MSLFAFEIEIRKFHVGGFRRHIRELLDDLTQQKVGVMFARVGPYLRSDMDRHRITAAVTRDA